MGDTPQHAHYEEMQDTPWITQGRDIADKGGQGILENYNKVNVFDEPTQKSLEARNNAVYQRAFGDADRLYKDIMNKYAAANYNQFGTLNATPAAYRTDMANLHFQRQLDDMAYNKAINYENIINNELQRRYNTLDMFGNLYQYGQTPYQQDVRNWNTRNTNKDIDYQNAVVASQNNKGLGALSGALQGGITGFMTTGNPWGAVAGAGAGAIGGLM